MKRISTLFLSGCLLAVGTQAQAPPESRPQPTVIVASPNSQTVEVNQDIELLTEEIVPGPGLPGQQNISIRRVVGNASGGQNFTFISNYANGPTVTGAPYSAEAVNETIQTLGDGNRIVQRQTTKIARDGQGRERREEGDPVTSIFISDPVEGKSYTLNPELKTVIVSPSFKLALTPFGNQEVQGEVHSNAEVNHRVLDQQDLHWLSTTPAAVGGTVFSYAYGVPAVVRPVGEGSEVVQKNLGTQNVEGVAAEGSRTTLTIPAGAIGNERAIEVVDERWYSPELKTTVMTRHSDPRSGETTFKLTNIQRVEPATTLFTVPSDYTVVNRASNSVFKLGTAAAEPKQ